MRRETYPQFIGQLNVFRRDPETCGEDYQIKFFRLEEVSMVHVGKLEIVRVRILDNAGDHGAHIANLVNVSGPLIVALESLSLGPEINEEDGGLQFGMVFFGNDRLLGSVHAAD